MIEGGGAEASQFRSFVATLMSVTNALNKQIKYSLWKVCRLWLVTSQSLSCACHFATWAPKSSPSLILDRLSILMQSVESWGYAQVSDVSGDPLIVSCLRLWGFIVRVPLLLLLFPMRSDEIGSMATSIKPFCPWCYYSADT